MENEEQQILEEQEQEELSYSELYATALLNEEIVITIAAEEEEKVRSGIKNHKNKQNLKFKEEGLPTDSSVISFRSTPSKEFDGCVDLSIVVTKRGTVKIKAMRIPENDLPE